MSTLYVTIGKAVLCDDHRLNYLQTLSFSIADFNAPSMMPEDEADEAYEDEHEDIASAQSGGGNTKGAVNQGRTSAGKHQGCARRQRRAC